MPDELTAALDEIRQRDKAVAMGHVRDPGDVPRLLAVVEEILKLHARSEKPQVLRTICARHGGKDGLRALRFNWKRNEIDACPDCKKTERYVCTHCHCPDDEWPCPTYRAISAALLGKAAERP